MQEVIDFVLSQSLYVYLAAGGVVVVVLILVILAMTGKTRFSRRRLVAFHTAHELLLRSHNEAGYRRLNELTASAGQVSDRTLYREYEAGLADTMKTIATTKKHKKVLSLSLGYFKRLLSPGEKQQILNAIEDYAAGLLPLVVPQTLLRFNIHKHGMEYLSAQLYFDPHPKELMLRNHV